MTTAYLDSSFLLSIVLGEPRAAGLRRILTRYDRLLSSDLIVAECLSTAHREAIDRAAMITALRPSVRRSPFSRAMSRNGGLRDG